MTTNTVNESNHPANEIDATAFDRLLPVDEFTMAIAFSSYEPRATPAGPVMELRLTAYILEGPHKDTHIPYGLVLEGPGSEIGQREFAALRRAVGILNPSDASELHHHAFRARVDVAMVDGELRNSIAAIAPEEDAPNWTPEQRFLFDLEGELYKMVALAETVETLLVQVADTLQRVNPPKAAALDYAATNLSDLISELSERYHAVRFPSSDNELLAA